MVKKYPNIATRHDEDVTEATLKLPLSWIRGGEQLFGQHYIIQKVDKLKSNFKAVCRFCIEEFSYRNGNNHRRLSDHMEYHTMREDELTRLVCTGLIPLAYVQGDGIRNLCELPKVTEEEFKTIIDRNYTKMKSEIKIVISQVSAMALILTNWPTESKVDVLINYIHNKKRQHIYLATVELEANLYQVLSTILNDWNIDQAKVIAAITKDIPILKQACEYLGIPRLPCSLEMFDQILNKWFEQNSSILADLTVCCNIRSSFEQYGSPSEADRGQFRSQDNCNLAGHLRLLTWVASLETDLTGGCSLENFNFRLCEDYIQIFELLVKVKAQLAPKFNPSLSIVYPIVSEIKNCTTKLVLSTEYGKLISASLASIFGDTFHHGPLMESALYRQTTYIDKRYKTKFFEISESEWTRNELAMMLDKFDLNKPSSETLEIWDEKQSPMDSFFLILQAYEKIECTDQSDNIDAQIAKLNSKLSTVVLYNLQQYLNCIPAHSELAELEYHRKKKMSERVNAKKRLFLHYVFKNKPEETELSDY